MSLALLRQQIAAVVAGTPGTAPGLPTGLARLDAALPGGGIPVGRITELLGPPGLGKTTVAHSLAAATIRSGGSVAWIDATRTLDPRGTAALDTEGLWVVRPPEPARGPWCADLLLRSAAFALVVLDGAPVLPRLVAVRLAQLARESDAALLLLGEGSRASEMGGALRLRLAATSAPRRVVVTLEKGGPYHHVPLEIGHGPDCAHRLRPHPPIPDRRGVARTRQRRR
jgi:recombination protein RecA